MVSGESVSVQPKPAPWVIQQEGDRTVQIITASESNTIVVPLPGPHSNSIKSEYVPPLPGPHTVEPVRYITTDSAPVTEGTANVKAKRSSGAKRQLNPDEEQKKVLRRLRNKEAAARCRKRRLDQTLSLQAEVDKWEAKKSEMEKEIQTLEHQKTELEELLASHRGKCKAKGGKQKSGNGIKIKAEES